jgi:hypothetical protein
MRHFFQQAFGSDWAGGKQSEGIESAAKVAAAAVSLR